MYFSFPWFLLLSTVSQRFCRRGNSNYYCQQPWSCCGCGCPGLSLASQACSGCGRGAPLPWGWPPLTTTASLWRPGRSRRWTFGSLVSWECFGPGVECSASPGLGSNIFASRFQAQNYWHIYLLLSSNAVEKKGPLNLHFCYFWPYRDANYSIYLPSYFRSDFLN